MISLRTEQSLPFWPIVFKSGLMAIIATIATIGLGYFLLPIFGARLDGLALLMCIICPMLIAWPASAFQFIQNEKLRQANQQITEIYGQLEVAHIELAEAHKRMTDKASRDSLTGVLNREGFFNRVKELRRTGKTGALLVIDIDHFKSINDRFGHLAGDDVLRTICNTIDNALQPDLLFGRIGGEEFAVFMPISSEYLGAALAETIRAEIANLVIANDMNADIRLTVSIGGALDEPTLSMTDFFKKADKYLYQAKRLGRNQVVMNNEPIPNTARPDSSPAQARQSS